MALSRSRAGGVWIIHATLEKLLPTDRHYSSLRDRVIDKIEGYSYSSSTTFADYVNGLLVQDLKGFIKLPESIELKSLATKIENACFAQSTKDNYVLEINRVRRALATMFGRFHSSTLASYVKDGIISPEDAVKSDIFDTFVELDPRTAMKNSFVKILQKDLRFIENREDIATKIETGCYNATIDRCIESADSYRRHWSSPMFVVVYSACCGHVLANIDPDGIVAKKVGSCWALDQLASGVWLPETLGYMLESELCPQANAILRKEVMERVEQKITEKTSSLFACPRCKARKCTYRSVQIGAGDEPSTYMCTCKDCGMNFEGRS